MVSSSSVQQRNRSANQIGPMVQELHSSGWTLKDSGLELAISKENAGTIDIVLQTASEGE